MVAREKPASHKALLRDTRIEVTEASSPQWICNTDSRSILKYNGTKKKTWNEWLGVCVLWNWGCRWRKAILNTSHLEWILGLIENGKKLIVVIQCLIEPVFNLCDTDGEEQIVQLSAVYGADKEDSSSYVMILLKGQWSEWYFSRFVNTYLILLIIISLHPLSLSIYLSLCHALSELCVEDKSRQIHGFCVRISSFRWWTDHWN